MIFKPTWTKTNEDALRECIAEKMTARQTGAVIGFSRNSCIGKARRMGLRFLSASQPKRAPREQKPRKKRIRIRHKFPYREAPKMAEIPFAPLNLSICEITDNSCKWIMNDDTKAAIYCGIQVAEEGCSWCRDHRRLAFQPRVAHSQ